MKNKIKFIWVWGQNRKWAGSRKMKLISAFTWMAGCFIMTRLTKQRGKGKQGERFH